MRAGLHRYQVASAYLVASHDVVTLADLFIGHPEFVRDRAFYQGGVGDQPLLDHVFTERAIDE